MGAVGEYLGSDRAAVTVGVCFETATIDDGDGDKPQQIRVRVKTARR